jgi:hypothetical protein
MGLLGVLMKAEHENEEIGVFGIVLARLNRGASLTLPPMRAR